MAEGEETPIQGIHAIVHGLVQGVNFRAFTIHEATSLGLVGWVRNKPDGTVETLAEGPRPQLEAFVDFLHTGSPSARVRKVEVTWQEPTGDLDDFNVRFGYS